MKINVWQYDNQKGTKCVNRVHRGVRSFEMKPETKATKLELIFLDGDRFTDCIINGEEFIEVYNVGS